MAKRKFRKLPKQLMSRKILSLIFDDFAFYGSFVFFGLVIIYFSFIRNLFLVSRLAYFFLISIIVIIAIKSIHYKERPQKEEFSIFIEKMVASSFPSTHSMLATGLTVFIYLSYQYMWLLILLSFISLMVYIQRYITKKHFVMDIIGGILIAFAVCIFVIKIL